MIGNRGEGGAFVCGAAMLMLASLAAGGDVRVQADAFSYLDDSTGSAARAWVVEHNRRTLQELEGDARFTDYYQAALASEAGSGSDEAGLIPAPGRMSIQGDYVYQVHADAEHPRGLWRRASLKSFDDKSPEWKVLLDVDALSRKEQRDWTLGYVYVSPNGKRCLLDLRPGGSLMVEWREFDLERQQFVADGFVLPVSEASQVVSRVVWRSDDSVLVSADFGPGTTTPAKMPFIIKEWRRGEPLRSAKEIVRGEPDDTAVTLENVTTVTGGEVDHGNRPVTIARYYPGGSVYWHLAGDGRLMRMTLPPETSPLLYKDQYVIVTRSPWAIGNKVWAPAVLSIPVKDITKPLPSIQQIMAFDAETSAWHAGDKTRDGLLIFGSTLAKGRLWLAKLDAGRWTVDRVPLPENGAVMQAAANLNSSVAYVYYQSFLQSPALYRIDAKRNEATLFHSVEDQFTSELFTAEQLQATSRDGAAVPYFVVRAREFRYDGGAPTLILGYGAGGGTQYPVYSGTLGKLWLERGGVYVVAGIRGGLDRGFSWWVRREQRQHTYEDMIAVSEDLIRRKITSPKRMGVIGYSYGGLLAGVVMNQRPDLYGAVVLKAPLLDHFRPDLLMLSANAFADELGSLEEPAVRTLLERTSPFQNLRKTANFPTPFILTSTTDRNVPPAQPRRFAAKMESLGMPVLFYETADGGHGLAATAPEKARLEAYIYMYLTRQLLDQRE